MTWEAVVLTGGESRRMGRDKATLLWEGEPLWRRQTRLLQELGPAALWISGRTRPDWIPEGLGFVADLPPSRGPLSGLAAALTNLRAPHLLALAVDLPWMRSRHLAQLLTMRRPGVGVAPVMDGRFEPLCAIYPREAGLAANEALARDERALQILVRRLVEAGQMQTYAVPAAERALYRNLNSPADF